MNRRRVEPVGHQLRRQIGVHLARGVPLKALCGLVSAGRTSGAYRAQPVVAGDGEGRAEAEAAFAGFPKDRVTFAGRFPPESMSALYRRADLYLWPGLKEAYGLAFLEAQASGLPVVACDTAGVPAVVHRGRGGLLTPPGDAEALAQSLRILLANRQTRETMGEVAAQFVHGERGVAHAAQQLRPILNGIGA